MGVILHGGEMPPDEPNKLMVLAYGLPGKGKSSFALSFPPPFYYYNLDRPIGPLIARLPTHAVVDYEGVSVDVDTMTAGIASAYLKRFDELVRRARAAGKGTIVVDGWDILWDIVKLALLPGRGGDNENFAKEFAEANAYMHNHLRRIGLSPLHACFTTMASPIWEGLTKETKRMRPDGFKHRGRWLTHEVYLFTPEDRDEAPRIPDVDMRGQSHHAYVGVSKINEQLVGAILPNLSFKTLWRLTYGTAYPEAGTLWSPAAEATNV